MSPSAKPSESKPRRSFGRRLLRWTAWTLGGLVLLLGGLVGFLETGLGKRTLAGLIEDLGSTPEQRIQLGTLEGSLFSRLTVSSVTLSDPDGPWLALEGVVLDWTPSSLFSSRLKVELLRVESLAVLRAPPPGAEEPAPSDGDPFALPSLPVEVEVARLELPSVTLDQSLLGEAAALSLDARALLAAEGLDADLMLQRLDGTPGKVTLAATWQPAADHLALDLSAAEPPGGLIARLLELPELPAVELTVTGEGPLSAWAGKLDFALDGDSIAQLQLTVDGREQRSLALTGRIESSPLVPPEAAAWVADGIALDTAAALQDEVLTLERLQVASATLSLGASGSVALDEETLDLAFELALLDPTVLAALAPDVSLTGLRASGKASGSFAAPALTLAAEVEQPRTPDGGAEAVALRLAAQPLGADALADGGPGYDLSLEADIRQPAVAEETLRPWPWGDIALKAEAGLTPAMELDLEQLTVTGQDLALTTSGTLSLEAMTGSLALELNGRLPPLPELPPAPLAVAMTGTVELGEAGALSATTDLTLTGAETLPDGLGELLGPAVRLSGGVDLAPDGDIALRDTALAAAGATLEADGTYGQAGVDLTWQAAVADLAALAPFGVEAAGAARLEGTLAGPSLEDMTLLATLEGENLAYQAVAIGGLSGEIAVAGLPAAPTGSISLNAPDTAYGPLALGATVEPQADGGFVIEPLDLGWGEALSLSGSLQASAEGLPITGALTGRLSQSPLLDQLGVPLRGAGDLAIELTAPDGRQDAAVRLTLAGGSLAGMSHGGIALRATAQDLLGAPALDAEITAKGLQADPAQLEELRVTAKGSLERLAFTVATKGELEGPLDLALSGEVTQPDGTVRVALAPFQGTVAGLPLALTQAGSVTLAGSAIELRDLVLGLGEGRIAVSGNLGGSQPKLDLAITDLDLATFERFYDDVVPQGRIGMTLALSGSGRNAQGSLQLTADQLAVRERGLAVGPALDLRADGTLSGGQFALQARVDGDFGEDLELTLALPLQVALERYEVAVPPDGPLSGRARWNGEVARLMDFVPLGDQELSGPLALDLTLGGTLGQPSVSGSATLTDGRYEHLGFGTLLSQFNLKVEGAGQRLTIALSATDGASGRLTAEGAVDLAASEGLGVDIKARLNNMALAQRGDLYAQFNGELALIGQGQDAGLRGTLTGERIEFDISADLPASVATLDVVVLQDGQPVNPERPGADEADTAVPFELPLDVTVDLPRRVFVRGSGLESEWAGRLFIRGTSAQPVITGSLAPQRGYFDLLGSEFTLDGGSITFDAAPTPDPILDLRAIHEGRDILGIITITGRASQPKLELSSEPELPQEEVLARVLFQRGTGQLSAIEAAQLAEAAAIMSGATGSNQTMVDRLRQSFGLDVLRLQGGEGDTAVTATVGQYLAEGVFVGVTQGSTPGSTAATVEIEVIPEVVIEGQLGESSKVGVRWQWDY